MLMSDALPSFFNPPLRNLAAIRDPQSHFYFAFEREFERVRDQVQNNLLPHLAVYVDRFGERRAVNDEFKSSAFDCGSEDAGQIGCEFGQVNWFIDGLDMPGLDAREIEQRVDKLE